MPSSLVSIPSTCSRSGPPVAALDRAFSCPLRMRFGTIALDIDKQLKGNGRLSFPTEAKARDAVKTLKSLLELPSAVSTRT